MYNRWPERHISPLDIYSKCNLGDGAFEHRNITSMFKVASEVWRKLQTELRSNFSAIPGIFGRRSGGTAESALLNSALKRFPLNLSSMNKMPVLVFALT